MGCCDDWESLDPSLLRRATELAWGTLRTLTGGLVGNCAVTVRPCLTAPCSSCRDTLLSPRIKRVGDCEGCWVNDSPCDSGCGCGVMSEIVMSGQIAEVVAVTVDGAVLDPAAYRVDNGNRLVRVDGNPWPPSQYLDRAASEQGTLAVEYVPGVRPGSAGLWAAGVLTCEFTKACSGAKCRLPSSVTSIARQGVSMEFSTGMFPDGMTGIREVDAFLVSVNPHGLKQPPRVWSPDLVSVGHRYTTSAGA
jgi:hypothetical protein